MFEFSFFLGSDHINVTVTWLFARLLLDLHLTVIRNGCESRSQGGPMLKLLPLQKKNPLLFLPPLSFSVNYCNGLAILALGWACERKRERGGWGGGGGGVRTLCGQSSAKSEISSQP